MFRSDFVRINLACRDITHVPTVAESTLGMKIFDLFFEKENQGENAYDPLRSGEQIGDPSNQSQHKKARMDSSPTQHDTRSFGVAKARMGSWARKPYAGSQSAPSKRMCTTKDQDWLGGKDKTLEIDNGKGASKENDLGDLSWGTFDD